MRRVIIRHRDATPSFGLDVSLGEILEALGSRAMECKWTCEGLNYCSTDEQDVASLQLAASGHPVVGRGLVADLSRVLLIIWGEFRGFSSAGLWVIIRAVDGSWWEVLSNDGAVFDAIAAHFKFVEPAPDDAV